MNNPMHDMHRIGHNGTLTTGASIRAAQAEGYQRIERGYRIGGALVVTGIVGMMPSSCLLLAGAGTFLIGHAVNDQSMIEMGAKVFIGSAVADSASFGALITGFRFFRYG
jgi:hypothetical protein